jgi:polysaccharide biosynthesis protein PslH
MFTLKPVTITRDDTAEMRRLVSRITRQASFDIIHAAQVNMAQFVPRVPGVKRIVELHNAFSLIYKRLAEITSDRMKKLSFERESRLFTDYERRLCRTFNCVVTVSDLDKLALVQSGCDREKIEVIPVGIDSRGTKMEMLLGANHILYIGAMEYEANVQGILWFVREVFPLIRRRRPDVVLDIVGPGAPVELLNLAGIDSGINVVGWVNDLVPFVQQSRVMVSPVQICGGMQVKILNAMAQGIPVVTTSLGCAGINVQVGQHLLVADSPSAFAHQVLNLLEDQALARQLGENGRKLVENRYDFREVFKAYETLYGCG